MLQELLRINIVLVEPESYNDGMDIIHLQLRRRRQIYGGSCGSTVPTKRIDTDQGRELRLQRSQHDHACQADLRETTLDLDPQYILKNYSPEYKSTKSVHKSANSTILNITGGWLHSV